MKSVSRLFLVLACIACAIPAFADFARGGFNGWAANAPMEANAGNTFYTVTAKATATSTEGLKFDLDGNWTSSQWGAGTAATVNSSVGSANWSGSGNLAMSATSGKYYTFHLAGWYLSNPRAYVVMETDAEPVTFSDASDDHATQYTDAVTVTATLSATPSTQEKVYLVYTVDNWTNRVLVSMTASGATATGSIPAQSAGTAVEYYVFTSTFTLTTAKLTDNAISTVWSDSGTGTSIPTADFVLLTRYPTANKSYTVTAKPAAATVAGPTGSTSLTLGSSFSLAYSAVNFESDPAWTCTVTPAIADAAVSPASGTATTFTATPETAGTYTLKVIATADTVSATNTATLTVTAPDYGNCWHEPGEVPDGWGETTMRLPETPEEGATNLFLVVGSYQPEGNMTTGTVYVSLDDGATWAAHGLGFDSGVDGGNKYWACNIDISDLVEGDTLQYAIEVAFSDKDTTYLGTTNQANGVKYPTLALAKENAFAVEIGAAPVVEPEFGNCWHEPGEVPDGWGETTMRYPLAPAEGATNLFLVVGSYQPEGNMTTGTVYVSLDDGVTWAAHGLGFDSGVDGGNKYWSCNLDISGLVEGDTLQYAIEVAFSDKDTTYLGTTNQTSTAKFETLAEAKAAAYGITIGEAPVVEPEFGNCWHQPAEVPTGWNETTMRYPLAPAEGATNLFLVVGSYEPEGNMTTGTVYASTDDGATWVSHALAYNSANGSDKFWACDIDISALSEGDSIQYAIEVVFSDKDTTYLGTTNQLDGVKYATLAEAKETPFEVTLGEAPVLPLATTVWHIPAEYPSGAETWSTPMRYPLALTEGVTNVAVFVGNYQADTDGANMIGGKIFYSIDGGAFVEDDLVWGSEMRDAYNAGYLKFWKADIDTSAIAEGGTLAYYVEADIDGCAPTYIISDGADGCVLTNAVDTETDALFTVTCGERVYNLGNCWHNPGNYEPWSDATMRNPCYPALSNAVCFFVGNQDAGDGGNPGDMSGGSLFWRYVGETAFEEVALAFENGTSLANNKYWKAIVDAADLPTAGDVEYYFCVTYTDHDDTYLAAAASGAGSTTYATAALACEHLFAMPVGDAAGSEPGFMWHAGNTVLAGTNAVQFWVKIGYTKDGVDWADNVELRYNIKTGAIPASVTASAKRLSAKSYRATARSLVNYTALPLTRDHEEEDSSEYGNSVWWMCTLTDDALAGANTYVEYQIAAKNAQGNDTWRFADYRTGSASNTFYYTMWQAGANELTVNGLNADYTTSKFFIDEAAIAAGEEEAPSIVVVYNPPVANPYAVELFSNVGRRDFWNADLDANNIPDAIFPPNGDLYTVDVTNGYYQAQAMTATAGVGYTITIPAEKTGAYRLTARYKASATDTWHYYSESGSGIRDHAVVISPKKVLSQNVYELNALTVKATNATRSGRSTFADLINPAPENQDTFDEFSLDYLNKLGANCLWFQPIHPATESGIDFDEGPGSPYAAKDYFAVARWFGADETEASALQEFHDFVAACDLGYCASLTNRGYVGTVNIMLDGVFNHTSWDAVLGERGVAMLAAKGITTYTDKNGQTQTITADTPIGHVRPNWYAYWQNYGEPASFFWSTTDHDVATAPDRGDFGKWGDTAELFYGRYAALVEHNPDDNGNYLNESDWFDWSCMTNEGYATAELWEYMGGYVEFWLDKTGHTFANDKLGEVDENGAAYDDYGIDGLRCDFGQGLPPQFWEYCINRARSKKWNFMFMAESLDGGVVSYRSNRHFDILNENFVFQSTSAGSPAALQSVVESRKSLYNGGAVLLNQTSHDEIMPYDDPWVTASRHAVNATFMGLPMMFNGQEQGIVPLRGVDTTGKEEGWKADGTVLSGFIYHELNFGKLVPHFKSWNQLRIWDEPPSSVWATGADEPEEESRYMAQWYGRVNAARLRSPALRSSNQYYLGRRGYVVDDDGGTYDNNSIFAVAKYEEAGAADKGKDAVLAFARFMNGGDSHYAASETYAITPEVAALLGISSNRTYTARNLAATVAEDIVWTKTGGEILSDGIWVNLTTGDGSNMYDDGAIVQYLKIELASGIVFGNETNAVCGTATNLALTISDAASYAISATANGEAFTDFVYDETAGKISYTPAAAGEIVFTCSATGAAGGTTSVSVAVSVAKGTPEFVAYGPLGGYVGETLADVALPETYAWVDATTQLADVGEQEFAAVYDPDPANWNSVTGSLTVTVSKGTLVFRPIGPFESVYGRTLGDVALPDGYTWALDASLALPVGTNDFAAHYNPDPERYNTADGYVTVIVAKATPEIESPTNLTATVGQTLADVALPDGFAWDAPETVFTAEGTFPFAWTYTPEDTGNWNTVEGTSDVVVTGGEEPGPDHAPRTTFIAVDPAAGTVTLAGEDYPEEVSGNVWWAVGLGSGYEWLPYEGSVTTNADATYTISPVPLPAMGFYCVGTPAVP